MNSYSIFLTLLAGYISFIFVIGYLFNRRQTSLREFLLGGRRAGPLSIGFSAAASWLTDGAVLAVIGFFMLLGMGSIWGFVAPNIIALLAIAFVVPKIRSIPAMTQPELLEIRYGSFLRLPVALIIIVVMILFTVADIKGFAMVLQVFYGIDTLQAAVIVGLAVAVYVTHGRKSGRPVMNGRPETAWFWEQFWFSPVFRVMAASTGGGELSCHGIDGVILTWTVPSA
jgi:SSS family solute:Na+ symporter